MGELQQFGGEWTIQKLDILTGYLDAYLVALKYMKFKKSMLMLLRAPVASLPVMGNEKLQDQQGSLYSPITILASITLLKRIRRRLLNCSKWLIQSFLNFQNTCTSDKVTPIRNSIRFVLQLIGDLIGRCYFLIPMPPKYRGQPSRL